jgi:hypothetical protein
MKGDASSRSQTVQSSIEMIAIIWSNMLYPTLTRAFIFAALGGSHNESPAADLTRSSHRILTAEGTIHDGTTVYLVEITPHGHPQYD